jgi:hypothetical protein
MKKLMTALVLGLALTTASAAPVKNIGKKHPNLAAAQKLLDQAFNKVTAAQKANEYDLGGHAAKAKDLIEQASAELKAAAVTANQN